MSLYAKILRGTAIAFFVLNLVPNLSAQCRQVGGALITNFGGVDANTTLGPASGDLSGAVAASILGAAATCSMFHTSVRVGFIWRTHQKVKLGWIPFARIL